MNWISPGYFATLGVPLRAGREILDSDGPGAPKVCLINEAFARRYFKGRNPLGYKIALGTGNSVKPDIQIVGVVSDSIHSSVRSRPGRYLYLAYGQQNRVGEMTFYARAAGDPTALMNAIRGRVRALDPDIPVVEMKTLERQIAESIGNDRLMTSLAVAFALLATLLAAIGIYGVMAYAVARRTREIGIRIALGARPSTIRRLVLREVGVMTAAGVVIGVPSAFALGRFVESMLYGVKGGDPAVIAAAVAGVMMVSLSAGYFPARRAIRISPLTALRHE
jgi:predicted permease